jgi:hypothetical protein
VTARESARRRTARHGPRSVGSAGAGGDDATFDRQLDELLAAGVVVVVGACVSSARADGVEADLDARGFRLRVARDELLRFTLEGATVVTF